MNDVVVANYNPDDKHPEIGMVSMLPWHGVAIRDALKVMFRIKEHEAITAVIVSDYGLKVKIVNKSEL